MNGTMARLLGAVAVASTLFLGGCVAETGEEQETAAAAMAPKTPAVLGPAAVASPSSGGVRSADPRTADVEEANIPNVPDELSSDPTSDPLDPEPSPWTVIGPAPHAPR
jgi:hypothetical protein